MKRTLFLISLICLLFGCGDSDKRESQTISFKNIPPQQLGEGSIRLEATATSGLPVSFLSGDTQIAVIEGDRAVFRKAGSVVITASQSGNDSFYEAPNVSKTLIIHPEANANKQSQTITFQLSETEWKSSFGGLELSAEASSGLPVSFICSDDNIAFIQGNTLYLRSGDYENHPLTITATQQGNAEYNPAANVSKSVLVECDTH